MPEMVGCKKCNRLISKKQNEDGCPYCKEEEKWEQGKLCNFTHNEPYYGHQSICNLLHEKSDITTRVNKFLCTENQCPCNTGK